MDSGAARAQTGAQDRPRGDRSDQSDRPPGAHDKEGRPRAPCSRSPRTPPPRPAALLAALALLACLATPAPALAEAVTKTTSISSPVVGFFVFNPCNRKVIVANGVIHDVIGVTINDQNVALRTITNFEDAHGVALVTGVEYRLVYASVNQHTASTTDARLKTTFVNTFNVVGPGPDNHFLVHDFFHVTVTPEGEVTAEHVEFRATCQ